MIKCAFDDPQATLQLTNELLACIRCRVESKSASKLLLSQSLLDLERLSQNMMSFWLLFLNGIHLATVLCVILGSEVAVCVHTQRWKSGRDSYVSDVFNIVVRPRQNLKLLHCSLIDERADWCGWHVVDMTVIKVLRWLAWRARAINYLIAATRSLVRRLVIVKNLARFIFLIPLFSCQVSKTFNKANRNFISAVFAQILCYFYFSV